ncbi:MAG: hypothetical protein K9H26_15465 [Prolixibacteraceae bacterium]|nr:hypothetical protein [Prolixibacteraceae bacterium]
MKTHQLYIKPAGSEYRLAFISSFVLAALTLITFIVAIFTPPISGPFCEGNCIAYPYLEAVNRFPRDYYWMYPAILLNIVYVAYVAIVHHLIGPGKKMISLIGVLFGSSGALLLVVNYFMQVSIIQPSLLNGETDGIALLTQFNPHGLFIVLEEAGFSLIALGFLFTGFGFSNSGKFERAIKTIFIGAFVLGAVSFFVISFFYSIFRGYYYECAIITIVWLVFIINGILLALYYRYKQKNSD